MDRRNQRAGSPAVGGGTGKLRQGLSLGVCVDGTQQLQDNPAIRRGACGKGR